MFKKAPRAKPSAPLKNSECRKVRAQIIEAFNIDPAEDGALLVPDGLHSAKFNTSSGETGIVYTEPLSGEPLWFTIGKGSTNLIPTGRFLYTLWKRPLLVTLSTPAAAMTNIFGGADLMIPGVISISLPNQGTTNSAAGTLVAIVKYGESVPLAVGRLLLGLDQLVTILKSGGDVKGKAVNVVHTFKDGLWELGSKSNPPEALPVVSRVPSAGPGTAEAVESSNVDLPDSENIKDSQESEEANSEPVQVASGSIAKNSGPSGGQESDLSPTEIDEILKLSLLQFLACVLPKNPDALPCPASAFLTSHMQTCRPFGTPGLDLKHSSYKSLSKFLKAIEKDGILKVKDIHGITTVISADVSHPDVVAHKPFTTVGQVDAKERAKAEREKAAEESVTPLQITELWKPHGTVLALFEQHEKSDKGLYTTREIKALVDSHVASNSLVHPREKAFIVTDELLKNILRKQGEDPPEFVKREEVIPRIQSAMQRWYQIRDEPPRKGVLQPIEVTVKSRGGKKAVTIITGFEAYSITAEFLMEELKRICASATSSGPIPGASKASKGVEVLVQGKHITAVRDLLTRQGIAKRYIQESDISGGKKK
ncbi:hypothetical protein FRB99_000034 [Tulasnella sp. 403]|nr:hypothetical protein FRB99_000034 [Tulasnella sp. 403]